MVGAATVVPDAFGRKETWARGAQAWFEYHGTESAGSNHAAMWYRSHQQVTVLCEEPDSTAPDGSSLAERTEWDQPKLYRIRFRDDLEGAVFEDELLVDPVHYCRPDPPRR